jgi:hypothetical protein
VSGKTWSVSRKTPSWISRQRRTLRPSGSTLDNDEHRRRANKELQAVSPNVMFPTERRHRGCRHHTDPTPNRGFRLKTCTKSKWENNNDMPTIIGETLSLCMRTCACSGRPTISIEIELRRQKGAETNSY